MDKLENFLAKNSVDGGFLQSWHWQKIQKSNGSKAEIIGDGEFFSALAIKHTLPIVGCYWFVPRGPILANDCSEEKTGQFCDELIELAKKEDCGWIRIEPQFNQTMEVLRNGFRKKCLIEKSKKDHEPAQTLMLNLQPSLQDILLGMKQKTRYNIKQAEKKGVKFYQTEKPEDLEKFIQLSKETAKRNKIIIHNDSYYRNILNFSGGVAKLFVAEFEGEIVAGAIVSFYGGVASYMHGASSSQHRNLTASHGLQWHIIQKSKEANCEKYDFGGIKISSGGDNDWQGITRFKTGFCPEGGLVNFPGCFDIIVNEKKYQTYRLLQGFSDLRYRVQKKIMFK